MKQNQTKKLVLNKKTVSVLQTNEMSALKGGAINIGITNPRSDSFVACGSCFTDCATNSTVCPQQLPLTGGSIIRL
jgi:natural product precursor